MATLFEYYNTGDDGWGYISDNYGIYGVYWEAQTFTPAIAHKITSVKLKLGRGGLPGILTVGIRATSGGHPTGADLCSGTTNGDSLPTIAPWEWREITLGAGYDLVAGTQYAIVIRALSGSATKSVWCRADKSSPAYTGGNNEYSLDSGSNWSTSTPDLMFEEWGESLVTAKTSSDTGAGADACVLLETGEAKTSSDVGSGVDDTPMPSATLAGSESGSGIDALIARLLAAVDIGTSVEVSGVEVGGLLEDLFAAELGLGIDALVVKREIFAGGAGTKFFGGGHEPPHRAS